LLAWTVGTCDDQVELRTISLQNELQRHYWAVSDG
jgi:hypothetical protein